tara:strand:- start:4221 stop:4892 length:672 start_codon:yes stop_codon:yes gene_type:complete
MEILSTEAVVLAHYVDGVLVPLPENETKWLKVFSSRWKNGDKQGMWLFASRDEQPVSPDDKKPNAVIIAATYAPEFPHAGAGRNCLVLTSEYRVPIMGREIGFPAGVAEANESTETAASREFKEETGLDLEISYVSPPGLYSSAGHTNESIQIVFGRATGTPSNKGNEGSEDIEIIIADYRYISELTEMSVPIGSKAWPILFMLKQMWIEEQDICGFQGMMKI